jgi:hypothetical protein
MIVDAHLAGGDVDGAIAAARAHPARVEPSLARQVAGLLRRRVAHRAALVVLAAASLLVLAAALRAARGGGLAPARPALARAFWPSLGLAVLVGAGGGLLAWSYEPGTSAPFLALGAALLPLALAARAWGAVGSARAPARAARAAICAATVLATALLLLEWIDPSYLGSFGL